MKMKFILLLGILLCIAAAGISQNDRQNEVTVEFFVQCGENGELDAKNGTTVTMEVTNNNGEITKLTYTFPKGSTARAITEYFDTALCARGFAVKDSMHDDSARKSRLTIRNVKSVKVGTSLNGKLPVTFIYPPVPPTRRPDTLPPPVITRILPRLPKPTPPPTPSTAKPHKGPTTLPRHGPGSIQIVVLQGNSSGGQQGTTSMEVTISISVTQGSRDTAFSGTFPKNTTATQITKYFYDILKKAGYNLKSYQTGDTQLFFISVSKLDGSYSENSARTTFGYCPDQPIVIDDKGRQYSHSYKPFGAGADYNILFPALEELNDYFDWINTTYRGDIDYLTSMQGFSIEGRYMFNPYVGLGAGFRLLTGSTSGNHIWGDFNTKVTTRGGFIMAIGEWSPGSGRLSLGGECSLGYSGVLYSQSEEPDQTDAGIESRAGIRLGYRLFDELSVDIGAGYQSLTFDDFDINWLSPGNPSPIIDLGGFTVDIGLKYAFGK